MLYIPQLLLPLINLLPLILLQHASIRLSLSQVFIHFSHLNPLDILVLLFEEKLLSFVLLIFLPPATKLVINLL